MKKNIIIAVTLTILAFYTGMAINQDHPMDELHSSVIDTINDNHVLNFKSGYIFYTYNSKEEIIDEWQYKQQGIYDTYSKYLHVENAIQFDYEDADEDNIDNQTSLSFEKNGELINLPVKESFYKDYDYFYLDKDSNKWAYQEKNSYDLLELFIFNSEILNRYSTCYETDNRGEFVVFYYSVDPEYLTTNYPDILKASDLSFPYKFTDAIVKLVVYPDTTLPRRIYSIFHVENLETHELININIDSYFSENEDYLENEHPEIPIDIKKYK